MQASFFGKNVLPSDLSDTHCCKIRMSTYHKNKEQRMPNDKITAVGANIAEKAAMIWNVADMLRGPFKPHEYGLVILPMTVVKRFHDCLLPTHQAVLDTYETMKKLQVIDGFLQKASGYQFYNISRFTFETLLADPDNIESNFRDYLSGFSANAQDVLAKFDFDNIIKRMVESNTLYLVIKEFGSEKGYLGPDKISAVDCGYIFEDLVRRFSESFGEEAGAHFTSRDIIYLMTDLLLSEADLDTSSMTVYDMAMGTSQMLSCMEERIHELNSDIEVTCFGQEFNPSTFAIAKADMMIRGGDPNNMRFGDTLSEDQFPGFTFQYIISNPPFGIDWKREQKAVEAEAARGEMGRFAPGLPKISDGQQLFVLNGLAKLANKGKMAIIQNGSPLFSGDAGSGPSNIRQYMHKEKSICEHYSGEDVISLTLNGVVKRDLENPSGKMPTTFDGYQFVDPNDLLLCLFDIDVTPRCVGLVKDYGVTSPAYSRFKIHSGFCNAYYNYLLHFIDDEKVFVHLSKNLRSSLTESDFGAIKTIVPPKAEQQRIADYLDNRTFEIDTLLSKARSSIEEYKKLKQAVITQAVTKGVRGEREMKDSGVDWIGAIPKDWEIKRLKSFCTIVDCKNRTPDVFPDGKYTVVRTTCIKDCSFSYD